MPRVERGDENPFFRGLNAAGAWRPNIFRRSRTLAWTEALRSQSPLEHFEVGTPGRAHETDTAHRVPEPGSIDDESISPSSTQRADPSQPGASEGRAPPRGLRHPMNSRALQGRHNRHNARKFGNQPRAARHRRRNDNALPCAAWHGFERGGRCLSNDPFPDNQSQMREYRDLKHGGEFHRQDAGSAKF